MRHSFKLVATILSLASAIGTAHAASFAQRTPTFPPRDYTCRFDGVDVPLGQQRCLRTPQGRTLAECGIALNMSTWRVSGGPCP